MAGINILILNKKLNIMKVKIKSEEINNLKLKGIYRIYNTKNNLIYIGSTWKSFMSRFKQHVSKLETQKHHCKSLQQDWNTFGTDCFICEILEIVEDKNVLLDRETFYIEKFDSYRNGYNENPNPNFSPMLNKSSCLKSSETHKKWWENKKKELSPEEYEKFVKEYSEARGYFKGREPWNKGIKMTEEQTKNMHKPRKNGVSAAMKEVHLKNAQRFKDKSPYIVVYDINKNWLNTFWCTADLVEYSKSEYNDLPLKLRSNGRKTLDPSKIANHCTNGTPYKGIYLRRAPKSWKLSYANGTNSWKAMSGPTMSQVEDTSSEGAETTGEV